jgi:hypothetical protein
MASKKVSWISQFERKVAYDRDTFIAICQRNLLGEELSAICAKPPMPEVQRLVSWIQYNDEARAIWNCKCNFEADRRLAKETGVVIDCSAADWAGNVYDKLEHGYSLNSYLDQKYIMPDWKKLYPLVGDPPVWSSENLEAYENLLKEITLLLKPRDTIELIYTKEMVDAIWEDKREGREKNAVPERQHQMQMCEIYFAQVAEARQRNQPEPKFVQKPATTLEHMSGFRTDFKTYQALDMAQSRKKKRRDNAPRQIARWRKTFGGKAEVLPERFVAELALAKRDGVVQFLSGAPTDDVLDQSMQADPSSVPAGKAVQADPPPVPAGQAVHAPPPLAHTQEVAKTVTSVDHTKEVAQAATSDTEEVGAETLAQTATSDTEEVGTEEVAQAGAEEVAQASTSDTEEVAQVATSVEHTEAVAKATTSVAPPDQATDAVPAPLPTQEIAKATTQIASAVDAAEAARSLAGAEEVAQVATSVEHTEAVAKATTSVAPPDQAADAVPAPLPTQEIAEATTQIASAVDAAETAPSLARTEKVAQAATSAASPVEAADAVPAPVPPGEIAQPSAQIGSAVEAAQSAPRSAPVGNGDRAEVTADVDWESWLTGRTRYSARALVAAARKKFNPAPPSQEELIWKLVLECKVVPPDRVCAELAVCLVPMVQAAPTPRAAA